MLVVVLLGGFTTNFVWCVMLNIRNRTGHQYFSRAERTPKRRASPCCANYLFCALAGTTWYFQFFFYTMGETQMGKYKFSSWTLHMASIIIFSSLWGIGAARMARRQRTHQDLAGGEPADAGLVDHGRGLRKLPGDAAGQPAHLTGWNAGSRGVRTLRAAFRLFGTPPDQQTVTSRGAMSLESPGIPMSRDAARTSTCATTSNWPVRRSGQVRRGYLGYTGGLKRRHPAAISKPPNRHKASAEGSGTAAASPTICPSSLMWVAATPMLPPKSRN